MRQLGKLSLEAIYCLLAAITIVALQAGILKIIGALAATRAFSADCRLVFDHPACDPQTLTQEVPGTAL